MSFSKINANGVIGFAINKNDIWKIDFDICEQPRETLSHYYNRMETKPDFLINGGFFSFKTGATYFTFIDDGEAVSQHWGVKDGIGVEKSNLRELVYGSLGDNHDWWDFISGYPVLVVGGVPIQVFTIATEINNKAYRSGLGYNNDEVFIVASTEKLTLAEFANALANIGCEYAINLDGGGSSRLLYNGEVVNVPTENRSVDSVVAIYLQKEEDPKPVVKPEPPYITYTVQKGDTMWGVATKQLGSGSRYKEIMELNGMTSAVLKVGQVLKIPAEYKEYVVQKGDTMWGIASKELGSGAKYRTLMEFNHLDSAVVYVGQIIYIPV